MYYRTLSLLVLLTGLLVACAAPTGPIRFYSGPPLPKEKLAIVVVPAAITVRSIDGKEVNSPSMLSGTYEVQLTPGHHLIAFRYEMYWGTTDTGMMIKSKQTGVDAVFEAGKTYELRYKVPRDSEDAKDYLTSFNATLVDLTSGQQYSSYEIDNLDALLAARQTSAQAPKSGTTESTATSPVMNADTAVKEDPVKRLKFWWLMANEQQRKQFTEWMKTANESFAPAPDKTPDSAPPGTINGVRVKP